MNRIRIIILPLVIAVLALAGCTKHTHSAAAHSAAAKVSASASAILHSGATVAGEGKAVNTAAKCGVQANLIKTTSDVTYKLTPKPVITSLTLSGHAYLHPGKTTAAFVKCEEADYKGNWPKIRNCVQANPPAFGKGYFTRLFQVFITCADKYAAGK